MSKVKLKIACSTLAQLNAKQVVPREEVVIQVRI